MVHTALCRIPRMFHIWVCKQVMDIAPANWNRPWKRSLSPLCPSCAQVPKTYSHVLFCNHYGWIDALMKSIDLINTWMAEMDTDLDLWDCMVEYAKGRGGVMMEKICWGRDTQFCQMVADQDNIGWRRFMEGMVCKGLREMQSTYSAVNKSNVSSEQLTMWVITKLSEATHGQWLYCCFHIHNRCKGTQATLWKEELQKEIEGQQEMGHQGLLNEDLYISEVNLEGSESTSGERQE
jgi:hypothetical protein